MIALLALAVSEPPLGAPRGPPLSFPSVCRNGGFVGTAAAAPAAAAAARAPFEPVVAALCAEAMPQKADAAKLELALAKPTGSCCF